MRKTKIDVDILKEDQKVFVKNNKLILKIQQRFKSEKYNVFTREINKDALSSNDDKRMQAIGSIETNCLHSFAYGTSKDLNVRKKILNVVI